jgi:hypothetical protein
VVAGGVTIAGEPAPADDLLPAAIGFAASCPDLVLPLPPHTDCGTLDGDNDAIDSLAEKPLQDASQSTRTHGSRSPRSNGIARPGCVERVSPTWRQGKNCTRRSRAVPVLRRADVWRVVLKCGVAPRWSERPSTRCQPPGNFTAMRVDGPLDRLDVRQRRTAGMQAWMVAFVIRPP